MSDDHHVILLVPTKYRLALFWSIYTFKGSETFHSSDSFNGIIYTRISPTSEPSDTQLFGSREVGELPDAIVALVYQTLERPF